MSRISVCSKVRLYLICDLIESPRRSSESAEASVLIPLPKGGRTRSYFALAVAAPSPSEIVSSHTAVILSPTNPAGTIKQPIVKSTMINAFRTPSSFLPCFTSQITQQARANDDGRHDQEGGRAVARHFAISEAALFLWISRQ